jgi:hypothetical protein
MMAEYLRVARLYLVLLAIFTVARFAQGIMGVEYQKAHHVFSLFILTVMSSVFYAVFCRRWRGYGLGQAVVLGMLFGLTAQVVIFLATMLSYALGMQTFFNNPTALNQQQAVGAAQAVRIRLPGLVIFPIVNAVAATIGWGLGGLLPGAVAKAEARAVAPAAPTVAV